MKNISNLLDNSFESSSNETPEFFKFYQLFVRSFKRTFNTIGATDYCFSKGHFYVSGFFKVGEQIYYFSLSDVRDMWRAQKNVLFRKAKSFEDYTGGTNTYVNLDSSEGFIKEFLRKFGLSKDLIKIPVSNRDEYINKKVEFLIKNKGGIFKVPSTSKANSIVWRLIDELKLECSNSITEWKLGRRITGAIHRNETFWSSYDTETKKFCVEFI